MIFVVLLSFAIANGGPEGFAVEGALCFICKKNHRLWQL